MKRLVVFQHVPSEVPGALNSLLKGRGFRVRYVNFGRFPEAQPVIERYHGLVVLGGPMHVNDVATFPHLAREVSLIQQALEMDIPVLGVCLGAQLIAKALGASVQPNTTKEIGWHEVSLTPTGKADPLLRSFGAVEKIFQWHTDAFTLPADAVHLARSETCVYQAFRYRHNVYGFQFHLEVDESLVERWLQVPLYQQDLLQGRIAPDTILAETARYIQRSRVLADQVFGCFVDLFQLPPKRAALGSY